ncbi:MAG: GNAT family N-acetyltransferase [Candidatus Delongbacteria bacterium]|nr:GNAT family N-acetyltransferase [Candidatus Cloacimonadota bacterium]MCA9787869.1 GNAT family N-acetyltransferase [Candidatus Cloacimonadota bacterium]MCB9473862.1 GNAT family N-acetyltransferase [Candidatus Delongbacteria bacterium]
MSDSAALPELKILPLGPDTSQRFIEFHATRFPDAAEGSEGGWCQCVAWWVPHWVGFNERSAQENLELRRQLLAIGVGDGWLATLGDRTIGWCQGGVRDQLGRIAFHYKRPPDPDCWAIGCLQIAAPWRRKGVARQLVKDVLGKMRQAGAHRVEAYPRQGHNSDAQNPGELWPGPMELYRSLGFRVIGRKGPVRIMGLEL